MASTSIELLFPYPWLFALGLTTSTCGFILLGALGQRYATIAFGALLIAVYTMLGTSMYDAWYQQPTLLIIGAVWYNLLTLIGHLLFPIKPLQENLARCYEQLANYLDAKANLFDPDAESDADLPWVDVAMANSTLVTTLNLTKASLLTRLKGDRGQRGTRRTLHYYFVAQDIHERASSSHVQYQALSQQFRHSDILFRFQRLLAKQARACQQLAQSILLRQKYLHSPRFEPAFSRLEEALTRVTITPENRELTRALSHLLKNLRAIDAQLANIESEPILGEWPNRGKQPVRRPAHRLERYSPAYQPPPDTTIRPIPPRHPYVCGAVRRLCVYSTDRDAARLLDPADQPCLSASPTTTPPAGAWR
ncbi:Inner membrane protein yccS [Serratia fonticola]|uniref:Inner membrane protein yccS n=1 Tax=Serratia fonticola TaxID=47917 RepID=A0A4U9UYT6_SERFO|nr:Inner membrane protein yccS [Serratia fonticola]